MQKDKGSEEETHVIIADGHNWRFDRKVLQYAEEKKMDQFMLWADASVACEKT